MAQEPERPIVVEGEAYSVEDALRLGLTTTSEMRAMAFIAHLNAYGLSKRNNKALSAAYALSNKWVEDCPIPDDAPYWPEDDSSDSGERDGDLSPNNRPQSVMSPPILPEELTGTNYQPYFETAIKNGWLDENYSPLFTNNVLGKLGCLTIVILKYSLGISKCWIVAASLWKKNNATMRTAYNRYIKTNNGKNFLTRVASIYNVEIQKESKKS